MESQSLHLLSQHVSDNVLNVVDWVRYTGVFCYAKVIDLDKDSEPDIYNAIRRDALLENVTLDAEGKIDFADKSVTENTRVSYPINHIENIVRPVSSAPASLAVNPDRK